MFFRRESVDKEILICGSSTKKHVREPLVYTTIWKHAQISNDPLKTSAFYNKNDKPQSKPLIMSVHGNTVAVLSSQETCAFHSHHLHAH